MSSNIELQPIQSTPTPEPKTKEPQLRQHQSRTSSLSRSISSASRMTSQYVLKSMTQNANHVNALRSFKRNNPQLSCRGRVVGVIRFVLGFFFLQSFFLGIAVAAAIVLSIAFMVGKTQLDQFESGYGVIGWIVATPWIMITFAMLCERALLLTMDAIQNSPRQVMNSHDLNARYEFIYTVSGGESPMLLSYRANIIAILTAAFVPRQSSPAKTETNTKTNINTKTNTNIIEPMFQSPDWIVLVSEILFLCQFLFFPMFYVYYGGGMFRYTFTNSLQAFVTVMFFDCSIAVVLECVMNIVVFFWPRAALIRAFITGNSIAMHAFDPYVEDVSIRPVVRSLVNNRSCVCCCGCKYNKNKNRSNNSSDIYKDPAIAEEKKDIQRNVNDIKVAKMIENPSRSTIGSETPEKTFDSTIDIDEKKQNQNHESTKTFDFFDEKVLEEIACSSVTDFDQQQFSFYDPNVENNEFESLLALNKVMRENYYSHIGPRWWFAVGSPIDMLWDRCFSRFTVAQLCCRFCCVNRRWNSEESKTNTRSNVPKQKRQSFEFVQNKLSKKKHKHINRKQSSIVDMQEEHFVSCLKLCSHLNYKWDFAIIICCYLTTLALSLVNDLLATSQVFMAVTVLLLGRSVRNIAPSIFGRLFFFILCFNTFILFVVSALAYNKSNKQFMNQNVTFTGWNENNSTNWSKWPTPKHKMLPICDSRWGAEKEVSVLDVGVLIAAIYDTTDYGEQAVVNAFAGGPLSDVILNNTVKQDNNGESDIFWQRWDFNKAKTTIFVVQGTTTAYDGMQNLALYAMSSSIELLSFGLALDAILPSAVLSDLIDIISNDDFEIKTHHKLKIEIEKFKVNHPKNQGWTTMIAGHSLGGSYANILGALLEIPSFTFSPPGLLYISKSLRIDGKQIELAKSFATSLVPQWDSVAKVDHIVGTRVEIPCTVNLTGALDMVQCHSPVKLICSLILNTNAIGLY